MLNISLKFITELFNKSIELASVHDFGAGSLRLMYQIILSFSVNFYPNLHQHFLNLESRSSGECSQKFPKSIFIKNLSNALSKSIIIS